MVYAGRPSTGCGPCRSRRKRCDETRPECRNCKRAGQVCSGYRNRVDVMFRHETANVVSRAKKSTKSVAKDKVAKCPNRQAAQKIIKPWPHELQPDQSASQNLGGSFELLMGQVDPAKGDPTIPEVVIPKIRTVKDLRHHVPHADIPYDVAEADARQSMQPAAEDKGSSCFNENQRPA